MSLPLLQPTFESDPADTEIGVEGGVETGAKAGIQPPELERARKLSRQTDERAPTDADGALARTDYVSRVVYWGIHLAALGAVVWALVGPGVSAAVLALAATTFFARMFGITAGYHRYFAHKTYKTGRAFQFVLALLGVTSTQKGPLWWAGLHRRHHR